MNGSSGTTLLGAAVTLGRDRVGRVGASRARARRDEDAVTLCAEAAGRALPATVDRIGAIFFCSTTPPYREGGSAQVLAEILGMHGDVFAVDLPATMRDGLAAVRLACALATVDLPVLVCAANCSPDDRTTGDGAAALVLGHASTAGTDGGGPPGLAVVTPAGSRAVEMRDRWRLPEESAHRIADPSFVESIGTRRIVGDLLAVVPEHLSGSPIVVGPSKRTSRAMERDHDGPPDPLSDDIGNLGSAQPYLRLLTSLQSPHLVASVSNGLADVVHVEPAEGGAEWSARLCAELTWTGDVAPEPRADPAVAGFAPYASGPRAWRERDRDLRLAGILAPEAVGRDGPARRPPTGLVVTRTRDHVYPGAEPTELAVIALDAGGQFFGQVASGEHVDIGDRVELVPRRLHAGNGLIQYFWKARPCR